MIKILTSTGNPIGSGISAILKRVVDKLNSESGNVAADVMTNSVKNWVLQKYPGSRHWDPAKVTKGNSIGVIGTTNVDIQGAGRTFHDVVIRPVRASALTIPIHRDAYHHSARDFNDLFHPKGTNILARNVNGTLVAMYALASSAFLRQDRSLMPTDEHLANGIFRALTVKLQI